VPRLGRDSLAIAEEDDILNVETNTIVIIVLFEYGGALVAKDPVPLSFSEMTFEKTLFSFKL
jgi:hypothetical protein